MCQVYSCIVLVLCASAVLAKVDESLLTDDLKALMDTLHKTCVEQTEVDEASTAKIREGEFEDDPKIKCYVKCVMTESGVMDDKGEIDFTALDEVIPEETRAAHKQTLSTCSKKGDDIDDFCEKAYSILKCAHEVDPDNYYFV